MLLGGLPFVEVRFRGWYEPVVKRKLGRDEWRVVRSPRIGIGGEEFSIREGYVSDFSSIPRLVRWKFSPAGRDAVGSIFHDFGLTETDRPKREVDTLYLALLHAEGVPDLEAALKFLAVRTKPDSLRRS